MIEKHFKVTLLSDVVISASLATDQTNVATLEYIPGSNFLGIVANACYDSLTPTQAQALFHSGQVSFGDAYVLLNGERSYPIPFCLYTKKGEKIHEAPAYLFHRNPDFFFSDPSVQFEQQRRGFFTPSGKYVSELPKYLSLKSAQDRSMRRSKDEAMYGMEALRRGLEFGFSVRAEDPHWMDLIEQHLIGVRHVGKSKSAQYGLVRIEPMAEATPAPEASGPDQIEGQLVVYVLSDLCLFDEWGMPTQTPAATHFGVKGRVDFARSQVRPHSFSTRNAKRNAITMRRDCIRCGSVIVIELNEPVRRTDLPTMVGGFTAEGMGWVCYNPSFLQVKEGASEVPEWCLRLQKVSLTPEEHEKKEITTPLARLLQQQRKQVAEEQEIAAAVKDFMANQAQYFKAISPSQWGLIRQYASTASDMDDLLNKLFAEEGLLGEETTRGKEWRPIIGNNLAARLKQAIEERKEDFTNTDYVVFLASEMAKHNQKERKQNNE